MPSFAKPVWSVSLSDLEVEELGRVEWEREDEGGTDFVSRCRRGVGIVREGLIGVIRGWGKEKRGEEEGTTKGKDENGKKEVFGGNEEWREEDDVGVKRVAGSVCGVVFGEVFGVSPSWCVEGGVVGVRGSDIETLRDEMARKLGEQQIAFETRLQQAKSEAQKREEEMMKEKTEMMKKETDEMKKRVEEMIKEKNEMEALIAELRKNQQHLITISKIQARKSSALKLSRSGDKFILSKYDGSPSTVYLEHPLTKGVWHVGFFDSTEDAIPDGIYIGQFNTSLSFCPNCNNLRKCHIGQTHTSHASGSVVFKSGDKVVLEVDMEAHMCHLFVNSVQTRVFARGIPASVKLAISLFNLNDGFEVKSFREIEKTKSVQLSDTIAVDF
ncbi:hypothetical protein BLNAU_5466 [Blattamonas nauphoetae]|uniref:SPRY domain-containing protein n=1 Tax=Blattamonas nauphoetae TaxID=2049346 RepID=A0ABQ9Y7M4_9EUKA|nr:hypothetical protein BLNAU_5466 [Blattamonas nauphoetae]